MNIARKYGEHADKTRRCAGNSRLVPRYFSLIVTSHKSSLSRKSCMIESVSFGYSFNSNLSILKIDLSESKSLTAKTSYIAILETLQSTNTVYAIKVLIIMMNTVGVFPAADQHPRRCKIFNQTRMLCARRLLRKIQGYETKPSYVINSYLSIQTINFNQ